TDPTPRSTCGRPPARSRRSTPTSRRGRRDPCGSRRARRGSSTSKRERSFTPSVDPLLEECDARPAEVARARRVEVVPPRNLDEVPVRQPARDLLRLGEEPVVRARRDEDRLLRRIPEAHVLVAEPHAARERDERAEVVRIDAL